MLNYCIYSTIYCLDTLRSQMEDRTLDVKAVSLFILELLGRLCCPERDEIVAKLREEDGIVELIRLDFFYFIICLLVAEYFV